MITKRIGFTGTRQGMTARQKAELTLILSEVEGGHSEHQFIHGDCIGADARAHNIALALGYHIVIYPCTIHKQRAYCQDADKVHRPQNPLARNRDIVNAAQQLIAAPGMVYEVVRSGTWYTVRYARRVGVPMTILKPW